MILRGVVSLVAVALAGCDTTDPKMGLATAQNTAAHEAAALDKSPPFEGNSAVLGAMAVKRYLSGTVRQPGYSAAESPPVSGDATPSPSPK